MVARNRARSACPGSVDDPLPYLETSERLKELEHGTYGLAAHQLGPVRTGVDVAVDAGLIALVAEVYLQGLETTPVDRRKVGDGE